MFACLFGCLFIYSFICLLLFFWFVCCFIFFLIVACWWSVGCCCLLVACSCCSLVVLAVAVVVVGGGSVTVQHAVDLRTKLSTLRILTTHNGKRAERKTKTQRS